MHPNLICKTSLYRISGIDFTAVDGFGALTVLILLSEVGLDPSRFPTVKHFTSRLTVYVLVAALLVVKLKGSSVPVMLN